MIVLLYCVICFGLLVLAHIGHWMSTTMVALLGSVVLLNLEPAHAEYWMANAKNVLLSSAVSLSLLVFVHIGQLMSKTVAALMCFVVH